MTMSHWRLEAERYSSPISETLPATPAVKKPRVRKSDGGGLWSVIQVILGGGAAAIPVTLLLLWYVVGKDVMDAGPTVARYAPWIVPKKFRSPPEFIVQRPDTPRVPPPALGEGGFRDFNQELGLNEPKSARTRSAAPQNEVTAATFDAQPVSAEPTNRLWITHRWLRFLRLQPRLRKPSRIGAMILPRRLHRHLSYSTR